VFPKVIPEDWRNESRSTTTAYQEWGPEFNSQYCRKKRKKIKPRWYLGKSRKQPSTERTYSPVDPSFPILPCDTGTWPVSTTQDLLPQSLASSRFHFLGGANRKSLNSRGETAGHWLRCLPVCCPEMVAVLLSSGTGHSPCRISIQILLGSSNFCLPLKEYLWTFIPMLLAAGPSVPLEYQVGFLKYHL
jgi:hypothetical protein